MYQTTVKDVSRGYAAIGCELIVPATIVGTVKDDDVPGLFVEMEACYDDKLRRLTPHWVKVSRQGEDEIGISNLQKLKMRSYCSQMFNGLVRLAKTKGIGGFESSFDGISWTDRLKGLDVHALRDAGPSSDEVLLWTGRVYRAAETMNINPAKQVESIFGISHATASRWIAKARKTVPDWYGDELQKRLDRTVNKGIRGMSIEEARKLFGEPEPNASGK